MNYRTSFDLLWIGLVSGGIIGCFFMSLGIVIILIAIMQAFVFYRCPHCKYSLLNVRGMRPNCCPDCGEDLK